jgi:hypothetical protein
MCVVQDLEEESKGLGRKNNRPALVFPRAKPAPDEGSLGA